MPPPGAGDGPGLTLLLGRRGMPRLYGWEEKINPRKGWALRGLGVVPAGRRRSIVLLHDELADGVLLLADDADEVGALGVAREVEGDCLIA